MGTGAGAGQVPRKPAARVALLGVDEATSEVLAAAFRQFGIQTAAVAESSLEQALEGDFQACVLPLNETCAPRLQRLRQTETGRHLVIYGICGSVRQALEYSYFGINAVFEYPVDRHAALRVVRFTHLLVLRELRRYVRVPLVASVVLETGTHHVAASTVEISAGGMSLLIGERLGVPQIVQARFELPGAGPMSVRSVVCWVRDSEQTAGLRFDPTDTRRLPVRQWIDDYLGIEPGAVFGGNA